MAHRRFVEGRSRDVPIAENAESRQVNPNSDYFALSKPLVCDECRPTCQKCTRSASTCTYDQIPLVSRLTALKNSFSDDRGFSFDTLDLILMHHYSTQTSLDLFPWQAARHAWQICLPQETRAHPLLLHGTLALAGMDIARRGSENASYALRALRHQSVALSIFRTQLKEDSITPASLAFSVILIVLIFASAHLEPENLSIDTIFPLPAMFRGGKEVWMMGAKQDDLSLFQQLTRSHGPVGTGEKKIGALAYWSKFEARQEDGLLKSTVRLLRYGYNKFGNTPSNVCAIGF